MSDFRQDRRRLGYAYEARALDLDGINKSSPWHRLYRIITADRLASLRTPTPRAIDFAAGTGLTTEVLCQLGYEVTAVETLPIMLGILQQKATQRAITVFDFDITSTAKFAPSGFGLATCTQAINFLPDLTPLLLHARDSLIPGGILYIDTDTAYRWTVIEALAGRPMNALAILNDNLDMDRQIIGVDYFFRSSQEIVSALERHGFSDISVDGVLPLVPLLHILHESADFLDRTKLHRVATYYTSEEGFDALRLLDTALKRRVPADMCGFVQFTAVRQ